MFNVIHLFLNSQARRLNCFPPKFGKGGTRSPCKVHQDFLKLGMDLGVSFISKFSYLTYPYLFFNLIFREVV